MLVRVWNNRNSHIMLVGMCKLVNHSGKQLGRFLKCCACTFCTTLAVRPVSLPMRNEPAYIRTYIYFFCRFTFNSQKLETAQFPSIAEYINKLWSSHRMEYCSKKQWIIDMSNSLVKSYIIRLTEEIQTKRILAV